MLFVIQNLLTLERLLPFYSVGYRARLLYICGFYKRDKGKILSVWDLKAHRVITPTVPLILNPVIDVGEWLTSRPYHCLSTEQEFRWAQSWRGHFRKKKLLWLPVLEPQTVQPLA